MGGRLIDVCGLSVYLSTSPLLGPLNTLNQHALFSSQRLSCSTRASEWAALMDLRGVVMVQPQTRATTNLRQQNALRESTPALSVASAARKQSSHRLATSPSCTAADPDSYPEPDTDPQSREFCVSDGVHLSSTCCAWRTALSALLTCSQTRPFSERRMSNFSPSIHHCGQKPNLDTSSPMNLP